MTYVKFLIILRSNLGDAREFPRGEARVSASNGIIRQYKALKSLPGFISHCQSLTDFPM